MTRFPFTAIVGADDMSRALILAAISPSIGGVLVRGEKGTAKSTVVRGLIDVLPRQQVVAGCRFRCEPDHIDEGCPDRDSHDGERVEPVRLVELPIGASEDRVTGSLDMKQALGRGVTTFEPGLLAEANRGILYVDEVNLLHDHLVDVLLDAAAMGRNTVEREGVSVSHAAQLMLVGTMNPEEGELRPQLLDRFGLTVEVAAPRDPATRVEIVRRRMAFDAGPDAFQARFAGAQESLSERIAAAQARIASVDLPEAMLLKIAEVCAAFDVDGMRADLVTARAARANAAWESRTAVTKADIRVAALLALPHRRRRKPFDAPGLDVDLLDQILFGDDEPEPEPEQPEPEPEPSDGEPGQGPSQDPGGDVPQGSPPPPAGPGEGHGQDQTPPSGAAPVGLARAEQPFRPRLITAKGIGQGAAGRRSRALTDRGRVVGVAAGDEGAGPNLPATLRAAAPRQGERGRQAGEPLRLDAADLRLARREGNESNLILFAVDASGSMAARRRMTAVKTAILSLLVDAYQRRDKVGMVTFRADAAELVLPPTTSIEAAAARLDEVPHGGRTPLAEGLWCAAETLRREGIRDPRRRPILVVVSDGRATSGKDALTRARKAADAMGATGVDALVIDCEQGPMRLGLAGDLAERLGAELWPMNQVDPGALTDAINTTLGRNAA